MDRDRSRILVVEDDATDAMMIRRAFAQAQVINPLVFVDNGDSAVDYLSASPPFQDRAVHPLPAFVLLDLRLPRRSGLEVLAWVRSQPGIRRIPVVVLTSSSESADLRRAYDLGCNSYLVKPVMHGELIEAIRSAGTYWLAVNQAADLEPE